MSKFLKLTLVLAALGAFAAPAVADQGGQPNENASANANGQGGNGWDKGNGHEKNAENPGHSKHDHGEEPG